MWCGVTINIYYYYSLALRTLHTNSADEFSERIIVYISATAIKYKRFPVFYILFLRKIFILYRENPMGMFISYFF